MTTYIITMSPDRFEFLKGPVKLVLSSSDGFWIADSSDLELHLVSETIEGLDDEFRWNMEYMIDDVQHKDDEELHIQLRVAKANLVNYIKPSLVVRD